MSLTLEIDPQRAGPSLGEWLTKRLEGATDVDVANVEVGGESGLSCEAVFFDASWVENGEKRTESLIARVAPPGGGLFPSYDLESEALVMGALATGSDVPTPNVLFTESDASVLGGPFVVMERIAGKVPADDPPYSTKGWVIELSEDEQRTLLDNAVATVAAVARADWKTLGLEGLARVGLDQQLSHFELLYTDAARGREHSIPEAGLEWLRANAPADEQLALHWGDARIGNMIFADDQSVAGALDWELAGLCSPDADIAYFLFALRLWSDGFGAPSPPGFPGRDRIIARYEELSGHAVEHLDYYERFAGVFCAVMVMRGGYLMIDAGLIPPDSPMPHTNPASVLLAADLGLPPPTGEVVDWAGKS